MPLLGPMKRPPNGLRASAIFFATIPRVSARTGMPSGITASITTDMEKRTWRSFSRCSRHALPSNSNAATLLLAGSEGTQVSKAKTLSPGKDEPSVSIQNPGWRTGGISPCRGELTPEELGRYVPYWTITDQDPLEQHPALNRSSADAGRFLNGTGSIRNYSFMDTLPSFR